MRDLRGYLAGDGEAVVLPDSYGTTRCLTVIGIVAKAYFI